jgi:hypothetical protein
VTNSLLVEVVRLHSAGVPWRLCLKQLARHGLRYAKHGSGKNSAKRRLGASASSLVLCFGCDFANVQVSFFPLAHYNHNAKKVKGFASAKGTLDRFRFAIAL